MKIFFVCVMAAGLTAAGIALGNEENLADNPSFEQPENGTGQNPANWNVFTSKLNTMGISDVVAHTGLQSLKMAAQKIPNAYQGITIEKDVAGGEKYSFSVFLIGDKDDRIGGTAHGMLVIEWKRPDGSEISRTLSKVWQARGISRLRWEQLSIPKAKAPKEATKAIFGIHLSEGKKGGKGCIYVDDVVIERH